jgi:hypothetical protein
MLGTANEAMLSGSGFERFRMVAGDDHERRDSRRDDGGADDRRVDHARKFDQRLLHCGRRDVLAAADDCPSIAGDPEASWSSIRPRSPAAASLVSIGDASSPK